MENIPKSIDNVSSITHDKPLSIVEAVIEH